VNKKILAVGALLASAGVHAQSSVTLFGVVDTGLIYQNQNGGYALSPKTKNSVTLFSGSGGSDSSEFGMQGVEDLGGGTQIGFKLLGQFNTGSGALGSPGTLFNAESNIYYQGAYGRVTAGQQLDPAYLMLYLADPRSAKHAYSAAGAWNFLEGKQSAPGQTMYDTNAVSYFYQGHGLMGGVLYKFGGEPGSMAQGRLISAGLRYDTGTVFGTGGYFVKNDTNGVRDLRIWELSVGYRLGGVTLKGLYVDFDLPQGNDVFPIGATPPSHIIMAGGGVNWRVTPTQELTAAYYFTENRMDTTNASSMYVLSDDYFLSKRTKLYGYVGLMAAKSGANALTNMTTSELTSGYPGSNTTTVGLGIQHSF
jgi:predicted porin